MTVEFNTNNGRTVPNWYTNMNNLSSNNTLYVKIAYLSGLDRRSSVARQIKDNLLGSGDVININAFIYNKVTDGSRKLNGYKLDASWTNTNNSTQKLPFPDPDAVESYITD